MEVTGVETVLLNAQGSTVVRGELEEIPTHSPLNPSFDSELCW